MSTLVVPIAAELLREHAEVIGNDQVDLDIASVASARHAGRITRAVVSGREGLMIDDGNSPRVQEESGTLERNMPMPTSPATHTASTCTTTPN